MLWVHVGPVADARADAKQQDGVPNGLMTTALGPLSRTPMGSELFYN